MSVSVSAHLTIQGMKRWIVIQAGTVCLGYVLMGIAQILIWMGI